MKVKLISDGTPIGTKIVNTETGELLDNVVKVEFNMGVDDVLGELKLTLVNIPAELEGEARVANELYDKRWAAFKTEPRTELETVAALINVDANEEDFKKGIIEFRTEYDRLDGKEDAVPA